MTKAKALFNENNFKVESDRIRNGEKPNYIVIGEHLGCPLMTAETAIEFHNILLQEGTKTSILDVRGYDWDKNPCKFKIDSARTYKDRMDDIEKSVLH